MREQSEVAGTDRSPARHDRRHVAVDERDQQIEHRRRHAGPAQCHRVGARQHRRAHGGARQRLADADRAPHDELRLERRDLLRREAMLEIAAEAGVEAVDGAVTRRGAFDHRARRRHPCPRLRGQRHGVPTVRDARQHFDVEAARPSAPGCRSYWNIIGNPLTLEGDLAAGRRNRRTAWPQACEKTPDASPSATRTLPAFACRRTAASHRGDSHDPPFQSPRFPDGRCRHRARLRDRRARARQRPDRAPTSPCASIGISRCSIPPPAPARGTAT